jgi:hypothetical protein
MPMDAPPDGAAQTPPPEPGDPVLFKPPGNFKPPEAGESGGKTFDLVCTFEAQPDGRIAMVKLGETDMPKPKEEDKPQPTGDAGIEEMAQSIAGGE